jgi:hypothetical protein
MSQYVVFIVCETFLYALWHAEHLLCNPLCCSLPLFPLPGLTTPVGVPELGIGVAQLEQCKHRYVNTGT